LRESILGPMDEQVLERARQRVAEARTEGIAGARLDAALERARAEVMRLAQVADELESSLPKQVGIAVRDGIAREVVPVSRSLAEKIVKYRDEHGVFKKPEDLRRVEGVGNGLLEKNRDRISVK